MGEVQSVAAWPGARVSWSSPVGGGGLGPQAAVRRHQRRGYGRKFAAVGLREFVNTRTYWVV